MEIGREGEISGFGTKILRREREGFISTASICECDCEAENCTKRVCAWMLGVRLITVIRVDKEEDEIGFS